MLMDRRKTARRKTFLGGRVLFNHRQSSADCIIRDLGEQGARLKFHHTAYVPDRFDVQVPRMERSFRAHVTWRLRDEIGVSFVDAATASNVVPFDMAIRLQRLAADKARLQQRVAELSSAE